MQKLSVSGRKTGAQVRVFLCYVVQYQQQSFRSVETKSRIYTTKRGQHIVFIKVLSPTDAQLDSLKNISNLHQN